MGGRDSAFGIRGSGFGFRGPGSGIRVPGLGIRDFLQSRLLAITPLTPSILSTEGGLDRVTRDPQTDF
jgi:hypothetical protein